MSKISLKAVNKGFQKLQSKLGIDKCLKAHKNPSMIESKSGLFSVNYNHVEKEKQ